MRLRSVVAVLLAIGAASRADEVTFTRASSWSRNEELSRRTLSPLTSAALFDGLAKAGKRMADQPIVPSDERFFLHVPPNMPEGGYALLVFVGPWPQAKLPQGWASALDDMGVIYVSAARSGNEELTMARREPLALLAATAVQELYRVDPAHVFVGGFSGGSRVAERLALAYPDLFRGAFLDAGSDRVGDGDLPLPPRELMLRFQAESHLVFATGEQDAINLGLDRDTMTSLSEVCVFGAVSQTIPWTGHKIAPESALKSALRLLLDPPPIDQAVLRACRERLDRDIAAGFDRIRTLKARGEEADARALLERLDRRYGGLAAPESLDLAR